MHCLVHGEEAPALRDPDAALAALADTNPALAKSWRALLAVRSDEELNTYLSGVTVAAGGVMPNIHSVLMKKKAVTGK